MSSRMPVRLRSACLWLVLLTPLAALPIEAIADLAPTTYNFSATAVGSTSANHAFTLTNDGGASLHIIGAQLPADFPIFNNNCPSARNIEIGRASCRERVCNYV